MDFKIPNKLSGLLESGEEVLRGVSSSRIGALPEYFFLTDRRVVYFDDKRLGRYDMSSIPYSKLLRLDAEVGAIRFGNITITNEDDDVFKLERILKGDVEPFIQALEQSINKIAVEPITITHKKNLLGREWHFTKPAEMVFKSSGQSVGVSIPRAVRDPLEALKMRYVNGEISKEEYEEMRRVLTL